MRLGLLEGKTKLGESDLCTAEFLNALNSYPEQTLTAVFTNHRPALRRLVAGRLDRRLQGRVDPSDIIQETLFDACQRLNEYLANPSVPFLKWLFALAEQNTITAYRRHIAAKKRSASREQPLAADPTKSHHLEDHVLCELTGPQNKAEKAERMHRLHQAISMLNPQSQVVVRMRFLEGKRLAEIGQTLNLSVDAVAKRAMRSILKLSEFAVELGLRDSH